MFNLLIQKAFLKAWTIMITLVHVSARSDFILRALFVTLVFLTFRLYNPKTATCFQWQVLTWFRLYNYQNFNLFQIKCHLRFSLIIRLYNSKNCNSFPIIIHVRVLPWVCVYNFETLNLFPIKCQIKVFPWLWLSYSQNRVCFQ